eukprot:s856_g24.t1
MAVLQCHSKLVAWAPDVFGCCARDSLPLIFVVQKTKLGLAICNLRALTSTTNGSGQTLLDLVARGVGLKKAKGEGDRRWEHFDSPCGPVLVDAENRVISLADVVKVEAKYGGIFSIHYIDGTVVTATFGREPTEQDRARENLAGLEQTAMEEGTVEAAETAAKKALVPAQQAVSNMASLSSATLAKNLEGANQGAGLLAAMKRTLAPQKMQRREENRKRQLTYTPVVQPPALWSRELVALVEEHSQGTTGPVSQFQSRSLSVLKKIQDEVVAVHRLIRDVPNNPQDIQAPPPATLEDKADAWYSSWTDLSHDDFSSAMYSVNSIFAKHDLAAYSLQIPEMDLRMKASSWVEARGLGKPTCPEDYALVLKKMTFEVCMNFHHNPSWLAQLPDAPVVDSPDRLRLRAEYDHRITLPIDPLFVDVKSFFSGKHKWAVAFQYYRCTGGAWVKAPTYANKPNQRHWIFMECGTVLPALSGFDYTQAHGHLLEIFDGEVVLQAIASIQLWRLCLLRALSGCPPVFGCPGVDKPSVCILVAHLLQLRPLPLHPQPFSFPLSLPEEHFRLWLLGPFGLPMDVPPILDTRDPASVILVEAIWDRFQPRVRAFLEAQSGAPVADDQDWAFLLDLPHLKLAKTTLGYVQGTRRRGGIGMPHQRLLCDPLQLVWGNGHKLAVEIFTMKLENGLVDPSRVRGAASEEMRLLLLRWAELETLFVEASASADVSFHVQRVAGLPLLKAALISPVCQACISVRFGKGFLWNARSNVVHVTVETLPRALRAKADSFSSVESLAMIEMVGGSPLMLFLTLVGCPISWHKNVLGKENRWLGYMVDISNGSVWLPDDKLATLLPALKKLEAGDLHVRKEVTSLLGKLQWVAKAYPRLVDFWSETLKEWTKGSGGAWDSDDEVTKQRRELEKKSRLSADQVVQLAKVMAVGSKGLTEAIGGNLVARAKELTENGRKAVDAQIADGALATYSRKDRLKRAVAAATGSNSRSRSRRRSRSNSRDRGRRRRSRSRSRDRGRDRDRR